MTESIPIPIAQIQELRNALDAALLSIDEDNAEVFGVIARARQNLDERAVQNGVPGNGNSDTIRRQQGFNMLRHLDALRNTIKKDYGLEG